MTRQHTCRKQAAYELGQRNMPADEIITLPGIAHLPSATAPDHG